MKTIFKNPRIFQRMHDGPLGSYVESYAAEMREQGYCTGAMESQIRLVADFSRWMMKTQISPQELTADRQIEFGASEHRHFDHGSAVTSHSAQGLTAERVLIHADTGVHPGPAQLPLRLRLHLSR